MEIRFEKSNSLKEKIEPSKLGFGKYFTDYMVVMDYNKEKGWYDARIIPYSWCYEIKI